MRSNSGVLRDVFCDLFRKVWSAVDEACVKLDKGRTGLDLFQGVLGGHDATHSDYGELPFGFLGDNRDDLGCTIRERLAGQASCFIDPRERTWTSERRICGDDAVKPMLLEGIEDDIQFLLSNVGSNFQENGKGAFNRLGYLRARSYDRA